MLRQIVNSYVEKMRKFDFLQMSWALFMYGVIIINSLRYNMGQRTKNLSPFLKFHLMAMHAVRLIFKKTLEIISFHGQQKMRMD